MSGYKTDFLDTAPLIYFLDEEFFELMVVISFFAACSKEPKNCNFKYFAV